MGHDTILNLFFEEPNRVFKIREIAKITRIPKTTVARELKQLAMQQLITSIKKKGVILAAILL